MSALGWHIKPGDEVLLEYKIGGRKLVRTWASVLEVCRATLVVNEERRGPRRVHRRFVVALNPGPRLHITDPA